MSDEYSHSNWDFIHNRKPVSRLFGIDRGIPIDRYYMELFLSKESATLNKDERELRLLEVGERTYSKRYFPEEGDLKRQYDVLRFDRGQNLTIPDTLMVDTYDIFICTQVFNFIYDVKAAIGGAYALLKNGGILLATVAGSITQISRYDMDRWGHYWGFTDLSAKRLFEAIFGEGQVEVSTYGNVAASVAFLEGLAQEDLEDLSTLDYVDPDYQMLITIKAVKR